ncbi:glycosyltransferase family 9 protein [bacterium]|nr:glycosyltransferase family 9 protein [bacterium]
MSESELWRSARRVLIVQLSAIGDVLRAGSVIPAIQRLVPGAQVGMLVYSEYADVVSGIPDVRWRHSFPNNALKRGILDSAGDEAALKALYLNAYLPVEELQMRSYDVVLNFHFSTASAYLSAMSCAKYVIGMGVSPAGNLDVFGTEAFKLYDVLRNPTRRASAMGHLASRYHRMCGLPEDQVRLSFQVPPSASDSPFVPGEKYFGVHIGAGWSAKCWPGEKWLQLIPRLHRDLGWRPVLIGTDFERDRCFKSGLGNLRGIALDFCGRPLMESARALSRCGLFIGSDSGPLHMASALNVPAVALFGETSAAESFPLSGRNAVIRKARVSSIEVDEAATAALAVADPSRALPSWSAVTSGVTDASKLSGVLLYDNSSDRILARRSAA